jgi:hypothetical protein
MLFILKFSPVKSMRVYIVMPSGQQRVSVGLPTSVLEHGLFALGIGIDLFMLKLIKFHQSPVTTHQIPAFPRRETSLHAMILPSAVIS